MGFENTMNDNTYMVRYLASGSPAAGANGLITFPGVGRSQLMHLEFVLANDANAASRSIYLTANIDGHDWIVGAEASAVPANATIHYIFWPNGCTPPDLTLHNKLIGYFNPLFRLQSLDTITITVRNIQVGDQITAINTHYRVWAA